MNSAATDTAARMTSRLRELLHIGLVSAPGCYDPFSARLAAHAARVTAAVSIPVLADVDTGFGGVLNIRRTIREMERAGIAGIHIEDQTLPKRRPALAGRQVVSRQQGIDRIRAACEARSDPDFVIVARTARSAPRPTRSQRYSRRSAPTARMHVTSPLTPGRIRSPWRC